MSEGIEGVFLEEAAELLADLELALLELEGGGRDPELVERVFRALHNIKGSGGMAGFDAVADFAHEVETVFEEVRGGRLAVSKGLIDLTLASRDRIAEMIGGAAEGGATEELVGALRALAAADDGAAGEGASRGYRIRFRPPRDIFLRGISPLSFLRELATLGECRATVHCDELPPLAELDPELCYLYWDIRLTTGAGEDAIRDVFIFIEDDGTLAIEALELAAPAVPRTAEAVSMAGGEAGRAGSVRVRSEKLDALVDLIGELVTVQARLSQISSDRGESELLSIAENVESLTAELRDQVLNIRMLPIGTTFSRFRRLFRDLSAELGKDVELVTEGAETELDKTVIERLGEPLVHLIRNCIDHGIEAPAKRAAAGKPPRGTVRLSARHSGGNVLLTVRDDGAGLDPESIHAQAVAMGLLAEEAEPGERELLSLIFHPGLSTAAEVSSVSGRGVGMDVVKRAIEGLRGSIEVNSVPGRGTTFSIRLPLTLAIIDGLLVELGGDRYVFPLARVEECIELRAEDVARANGRHLVDVRGDILPYIRLREQFAVPGDAPAIEQIVIADCEGQRVGFVVDKVIGEHQTVIKSLGRMCRGVRGLSGVTVLGDGGVALILDLPQLMQVEEALACAG